MPSRCSAKDPTIRWVSTRTTGQCSSDSLVVPSVIALGPEATQTIFTSKAIGPFFPRGLILLDFDEHLAHKRIMQGAFTRSRIAGYVEDTDRVAAPLVVNWPTDDARVLFYPAIKEPPHQTHQHHGHRLADALMPRICRLPTSMNRPEGSQHLFR